MRASSRSRAPRRLRATQRWFLDEVVDAAGGRAPAEDVVLPSATLTAPERMSIYRRMYVGRLLECIENDFPSTKAIVGGAMFARLAARYVAKHPPTSWTLNHLGRSFPAFLGTVPGLRRAALVRDVAAIERAISDSFDAEDTPPLTRTEAEGVPATAWPTARLRPSASLRVLSLATSANQAVTTLRQDGPLPRRLAPGPTWVAVYRKDLRIWRLDLTRPMHAALSSLVRGRTIGDAVTAAGRVHGDDPGELPTLVRNWFALWIDEGLFAGVELAPRRHALRFARR